MDDSQAPRSHRRIASAHSIRGRSASHSPGLAVERNAPLPANEASPPVADSQLAVEAATSSRFGERSSSFSNFLFKVEDFRDGPNPFDPSPRATPQPVARSPSQNSSRPSSHAKSQSVDATINAFRGFSISRESSSELDDSPGPSESRPSLPGRSSLSPFQSFEASRAASEDPFASQESVLLDEAHSYDPSTEPRPDHVYFSGSFQDGLTNARSLAAEIAASLKDYQDLDAAQAKRLVETASKCATAGGDSTKSVAILGDSGTGKSTLINSLLNCPGLAYAGGSGEAVTSVVTEFRYKSNEQTSPFKIEMQFCSGEESEELIRELVWSYRHLRLTDTENLSSDDFKKLETEHETAWSSLKAAFGHHRELKNLCERTTEGAEEEIVQQLLAWKRELRWPDGHTDGRWESFFDSAEECCDKTSEFMEDRFWPFINVIRVYLKAQVLETGLVLVDLPGLRDVNLAKVKLTEEYLLRTDHVFITTRIDRAITNKSLKESLFGALRQHVPNEIDERGADRLNVTIVCTRAEPSDDIEIAQLKNLYVSKRKSIDKRTVDDLENRIKDAGRLSNRTLKKKSKQELRYLLMKARIDDVTEKLQQAYLSQTNGKSLEIFCVANSEYEKCARKGDTEGVRASGVPALRRRCHLVSADARMLEARTLLLSTLPGLLESVMLWIRLLGGESQKTLDDRGRAGEEVDRLESLSHEITTNVKDNLTESFRENILRLMNFQTQNGKWEDAAKAKSQEWMRWHHMSYAAWCNNDGTHSTAAQGFRRWNNELIWKMRSEILEQWQLFEGDITDEINTAVESLKTTLTSMSTTFEATENFAQAMRLQIGNLEYKLGVIKDSGKQQSQLLLRKIVEDNSTSFILQAMRPAYRRASLEGGRGSDARRKANVNGQISNGLFEGICANIDNASEKLIKGVRNDIDKVLQEMVASVKADFEVAYASPDLDLQRAADAAKELGDEWTGWQEEMERIKRSVESSTDES